MSKIIRVLNSIAPITENDCASLVEIFSTTKLSKGEYWIREGKKNDRVAFVEEGYMRKYYLKDGKELTDFFYFENDFATNIRSLRTSSKSEYSIKAHEKTNAVVIDKTKLLEAYKQSHQVETFGRKVLELIMAKQEEHADSFKLLSPKQRFDNLVSQYPDFLQRVSLTQTASYLGISRETLSRFRAVK